MGIHKDITNKVKANKKAERKEKFEHSKPVVAFKNGTRLIEVTALAVVAGTTIFRYWPGSNDLDIWGATALGAGVIIALRASWEFFNYLSKDV